MVLASHLPPPLLYLHPAQPPQRQGAVRPSASTILLALAADFIGASQSASTGESVSRTATFCWLSWMEARLASIFFRRSWMSTAFCRHVARFVLAASKHSATFPRCEDARECNCDTEREFASAISEIAAGVIASLPESMPPLASQVLFSSMYLALNATMFSLVSITRELTLIAMRFTSAIARLSSRSCWLSSAWCCKLHTSGTHIATYHTSAREGSHRVSEAIHPPVLLEGIRRAPPHTIAARGAGCREVLACTW